MGQFRISQSPGVSLKKTLIVNLESICHSDIVVDINSAYDVLVLNMLWDTPPIDQWKDQAQKWINQARSIGKQTILIINSRYRNEEKLIETIGSDETIFFDFFLTLVYVRLYLKNESKICDHWHPTGKFLFLTGKPNRKNRIGFVHRLYQEGLLDHCIWSLFVPDNFRHLCYDFLDGLDRESADKWIDEFQRNPDGIAIIPTENSMHYSGIPYGDIYESASFQLVSETFEEDEQPWLTEKTWLPIINRRPFISMSYPGNGACRILKDLGFLTFDEFLIDNEFDLSEDRDSKIRSAIRNIKHWLEILPRNEKKVAEIVEHNYNHLLSLAEKNIEHLRKIGQKYGLDNDIETLIKFHDPHQYSQWSNWYSRIRDPQWPDCEREQDFRYLPDRIQKECIEVFGYRPQKND